MTLDAWADLVESRKRPTRYSHVGPRTVKTVWLGIVDQRMPEWRLFGTAVYTDPEAVTEVELYDTKDEAYDGHQRHVEAMREGFHCDGCRTGKGHA